MLAPRGATHARAPAVLLVLDLRLVDRAWCVYVGAILIIFDVSILVVRREVGSAQLAQTYSCPNAAKLDPATGVRRRRRASTDMPRPHAFYGPANCDHANTAVLQSTIY